MLVLTRDPVAGNQVTQVHVLLRTDADRAVEIRSLDQARGHMYLDFSMLTVGAEAPNYWILVLER